VLKGVDVKTASNTDANFSAGMQHAPFARSAAVYDVIYGHKEYAKEAVRVRSLVDPGCDGQTWLDLACGTGRHIAELQPLYRRIVGLDLSPEMIEVAEQGFEGVEFRVGDIASFDVGSTFDVVSCLFGSIGYCATTDRLQSAIASMAKHLNAGRRLVVEPWMFGNEFKPGTVHSRVIDTSDLKVVRMNTNRIENGCAVLEFHHLVGDRSGTEHYVENHILGLFEIEDYERAFLEAGLSMHTASGDGFYLVGEKP
jgi:SAM-dependent methyltransferase